MRRCAIVAAVGLAMLVGASALLWAQGPGQWQGEDEGYGAFAGAERVAGEVTAVSGWKITVKTGDGATMQIVTTNNTHMMKDHGVTLTIAELKVGDGVMAAGNLDALKKTLHAAILLDTDAEQVKALRENLGKTYIVGTVTAIDMDNARMTIERPDRVVQTIRLDETTSFRRGGHGGVVRPRAGTSPPDRSAQEAGESITLADIRVGDSVRGTGATKSGTFVPTRLVIGASGQRQRRRGDDGTAQGAGLTPAEPQ